MHCRLARLKKVCPVGGALDLAKACTSACKKIMVQGKGHNDLTLENEVSQFAAAMHTANLRRIVKPAAVQTVARNFWEFWSGEWDPMRYMMRYAFQKIQR